MNFKRIGKGIIFHLKKSGYSRFSSGQAIVLIALAAIGLFAMMGLAIDGGRMLLLRRDTQNASDTAAIAAARALCAGRDPVVAGLAAASVDGYDNNGDDNWVTITYPASNLPESVTSACAACFVEVTVRGAIDASFISLVYDGPLEATSTTISTCNPDMTGGSAPSDLRALWAKGNSSTCPNASVSVTGSDVSITGGVHSNGVLQVNASPGATHVGEVIGPSSYVTKVKNEKNVDWLVGDGATSEIITSAGVCSSSCFLPSTNDTPYPGEALYKTEEQGWPIQHDIVDYRPTGDIAKAAKARGEYYEVPCQNGNNFMTWAEDTGLLDTTTKTLKDGIYYSSCNLQFGQGGSAVPGADDLLGNVTFVSEGEMHLTGARTNVLPYDSDGDGDINDELLVFCNDDKKGVHFSGSDNIWSGNIYVPRSHFQVSGSNNAAGDNNTYRSCIVAECIDFSGSNNFINCDPGDAEPGPPAIFLAQ